jgi:hypothetical protein
MELPHCIHRGEQVEPDVYQCSTDRLLHDGTVPAEICQVCPYANRPRLKPEGLGDTVHKFVHSLRIDKLVHKLLPRCGCNKRKTWLNRLLRYNSR